MRDGFYANAVFARKILHDFPLDCGLTTLAYWDNKVFFLKKYNQCLIIVLLASQTLANWAWAASAEDRCRFSAGCYA